jgi:hypothetical protein
MINVGDGFYPCSGGARNFFAVGRSYDDFRTEDSQAVNHPLDKTLTSDNL